MPAENHIVKPSFSIQSNAAVTDAHLFVFAGGSGISFAVLDRQRNMFVSLCIYQFANDKTADEKNVLLGDIISNEVTAQQFYSKTDIIWCVPQSIITPQSFFTREYSGEMLDLVFGDAGTHTVKHELVLKQHAYNVYRVDGATEKKITGKFPAAVQWHQSSLMLNFEADKKNWLYCNFNPGSLTIMLRKNSRLQCLQVFEYNTPEDAAYHILNVCNRFETAAGDTMVCVSGMIDETSALYSEVYKYFSAISFFELPDVFAYSDDIKSYPAHYFSHLFATAACVL